MVQDVGEKKAVWVPQEVIHRSTEMQKTGWCSCWRTRRIGPTPLPLGLFEEIMGAGGELIRKPLRVNVTMEDTVRIQISTAQFERRADDASEEFRFSVPCTREYRAGRSAWCRRLGQDGGRTNEDQHEWRAPPPINGTSAWPSPANCGEWCRAFHESRRRVPFCHP